MASLDDVAERLQASVYRRVLKEPGKRHQIVGQAVGDRRAWAVREGGKSAEPPRRLRDVFRRPATPRLTVAEHDAAAWERRLATIVASGAELEQNDQGKWYRKDGKGRLVAVETPSQLVQARVARGEREALAAAKAHAKRLKVPLPMTRRRPDWSAVDPRVKALYDRTVAMHSSRIAHDALVDTYRDAAFDRFEQIGVGWVRRCEPTACGACLALADGTVHPPTYRRFYRHTRCRCVPVPASAKRPPTGQQIFDRYSSADQDRLFHGRGGAQKAQLLRDRRITLADLVTVDQARTDRTDYVVGETPMKGLPAPND